MRATYRGRVLAESDDVVTLDGYHYFRREDVRAPEALIDSAHTSFCGYKGDASYYHVEVDGHRAENACWTYAEPYKAAEHIRGRVAFWKDVEVG